MLIECYQVKDAIASQASAGIVPLLPKGRNIVHKFPVKPLRAILSAALTVATIAPGNAPQNAAETEVGGIVEVENGVGS